MRKISVSPGEEVLTVLAREVQRQGITSGAIVSLVGAVDRCAISNMPAGDAKSEIRTEYKQPLQLSGTGEINDGVPHIHCVLGAEGDGAMSGHLLWAQVDTWFVNAYVVAMEEQPRSSGPTEA